MIPLRPLPASLALLALAVGLPDAHADGSAPVPDPLRVAFIAYQNPDQLLVSVEPVTQYLSEELGRPIESFVATDYAAVVEALKNSTADVGFMGPLQYVIAHQQAGARPILGEIYNGSPTYVSKIFVRKDSGIDTLTDLRDKTIAFVDPLSSSGYLYPLDVFLGAGLVTEPARADEYFRRTYFAGGDEQAIRAVFNGFVDAAGVGEYSLSLLLPEERDELRALAESQPIPSHGVVVRHGLDPSVASALQQALLRLNEGENRVLLEHLYSVDGYVVADHETYRPVEELARQHGFLPSSETGQ